MISSKTNIRSIKCEEYNHEYTLDQFLTNGLYEMISEKIDEEINKKVSEFEEELFNKKADYINKIMNSIKITHEIDPLLNSINYKIIIENTKKIEG